MLKRMDNWRVERLARGHHRDSFDCGQAPLNRFLSLLVSQYEQRNLGRTYVAVRGADCHVFGYYTIASGALDFVSLPLAAARKLPRHPVPVILIARLAVDRTVQGQGLGELLLLDALTRSVELSEKVGIHAVVVEALDQNAKAFYERYGFIPLLDSELHLYLPVTTVRASRPKH